MHKNYFLYSFIFYYETFVILLIFLQLKIFLQKKMPRLSNSERSKVITKYNELSKLRLKNTCKKVSEAISIQGISISERGVRDIIDKWLKTSMLFCFAIFWG